MGESGVCLSGVKRSEFSRGPNFPEHRSVPRKGLFLWGAVSWSFFRASKEGRNAYSGLVESNHLVNAI